MQWCYKAQAQVKHKHLIRSKLKLIMRYKVQNQTKLNARLKNKTKVLYMCRKVNFKLSIMFDLKIRRKSSSTLKIKYNSRINPREESKDEIEILYLNSKVFDLYATI